MLPSPCGDAVFPRLYKIERALEKLPSPCGDEVFRAQQGYATMYAMLPSPCGDEVFQSGLSVCLLQVASYRPLAGMRCFSKKL